MKEQPEKNSLSNTTTLTLLPPPHSQPHPITLENMSKEIEQEETFRLSEVKEEDPNAVYVEFNPEIALEKLTNLDKLKFPEKQSYTRHLAELIGIIGDKGLEALPGIFANYVKESQQIKRQLLQQITPLVTIIQANMAENYSFKYRLLIDSFVPLLSSLLLCSPIHVSILRYPLDQGVQRQRTRPPLLHLLRRRQGQTHPHCRAGHGA